MKKQILSGIEVPGFQRHISSLMLSAFLVYTLFTVLATAGRSGGVPFTADGPRIVRVNTPGPCVKPGRQFTIIGRLLSRYSRIYAFGTGSRSNYRRPLRVVQSRNGGDELTLKLPSDAPPPRVRLVLRYNTGDFSPTASAPEVAVCAQRQYRNKLAGISPNVILPNATRGISPSGLRQRGQILQQSLDNLRRVRREGARGSVVVRELRLEQPRVAPDHWKEWLPVAILENTDHHRSAAVHVYGWGRTGKNPARRLAPTKVYDLGWRILRPGERQRIALRAPITWTECARVWIGGEGARNSVRGTPSENTRPATEACKGDPRAWRVIVQAGVVKVWDDGDRRSPTTWHVCLNLDNTRRCTRVTVQDGQTGRPIFLLTVDKTYRSLRGVIPNARMRIVDRDDLLHGGGDDIAEASLQVLGLAYRARPYDASLLHLYTREGDKYRQFSAGPGRKGPSGQIQYQILYEPIE